MNTAEPSWIKSDFAILAHDVVVSEIGGSLGIRDVNMLESALGKAQNTFYYGSDDIFEVAAAYAEGISRNHPFIDGNKRTAFVVAGMFLEQNGYMIDEKKALLLEDSIIDLAQGKIDSYTFAQELKQVTVVHGGLDSQADLEINGDEIDGPFCPLNRLRDGFLSALCRRLVRRDEGVEEEMPSDLGNGGLRPALEGT